MKRSAVALAGLMVVLALPFLARVKGPARTPPSDRRPVETLVIATPHKEEVRFEFGRAFQEYMARRGRHVELDWRTPGGAAEIARYLASEYTASFERYWTSRPGRRWSARVASGFMRAPQGQRTSGDDEVSWARREFLASQVGCGIDLLFGGGSSEHVRHADAGRLVDAGLVARHPETFGPAGIPREVGGQTYWDARGRWMGTCLSSFGICFNEDVLRRLHMERPSTWEALGDPRLYQQVALADPTKSSSIAKAFETVVQAEMGRAGVVEGWARAMRLIRRMGANARYFTDASSRIPLDVAAGDAAAGMCIDFYGRFQSETMAAIGHPERVGFLAPRGATATDADPISLLRGAPHPELAVAFIEFVLSEAGQKVWAFRRGTPGGPQRYSLRRLAILPRIYDRQFAEWRSDPDENPYQEAGQVDYHRSWTGPILGAMAFVIRVMCVDSQPQLQDAYGALTAAGFPPRATAAFDDVSLIDYATVSGPIAAALKAPEAFEEAEWARKLGQHFRDLYRNVQALAREGR